MARRTGPWLGDWRCRWALALGLALGLGAVSGPARADLWSYERDGTVMFTNIPPSGDKAHKWQVVFKAGPGKAQGVSGTGPAGCRASRADVVPARDQSPERFHRYDRYIREAAAVYGLPEAFIRSIIKVESDFDPQVVSCAGARGLMQIMPEVQEEQRITDVFDPRRNILGGTRLLRLLANRFHGDLVLTIAGFHAGPGAVLKYDGVPPYETTQLYIRLVLKQYLSLQGPGSALTAVPPAPGGSP